MKDEEQDPAVDAVSTQDEQAPTNEEPILHEEKRDAPPKSVDLKDWEG